jgi:hypothetical protein
MVGTRAISAESGALASVVSGARDTGHVSGLTHNFYRYPARFSPTFVRSAIEAFTSPGDWVLDPFGGGGTTLVEALALGRNAVGADISSLATFVSEAKTAILDDDDVLAFERWIARLPDAVNIHAPSIRFDDYADAGYYRNIDDDRHWRIRKTIEQVLATIGAVRRTRTELVARCALLRTAQWALDSRKTLPSIDQFRSTLAENAESVLAGAVELRARVQALGAKARPQVICLNRSSVGLETDEGLPRKFRPKLIVTSPPYPGIHVLYHRWQVDGRKETPAPFWIANRLDGSGSSYYTMGDRKDPELKRYFDDLAGIFGSIGKLCGPDTVVVQMVAFADAAKQLPRYLEVMESCGLSEVRPWQSVDSDCGRLWRDVPNRKWHATQKQRSPGSREVVLVHRKGS